MEREFSSVSLPYEIKEAIDGRHLLESDLAQVDWSGRRRLGLRPQARGSIANWLTQREVMQDLIQNGPEMVAIFEDDARFDRDLPEVLDRLESKPFSFDVVSLLRSHPKRPFVPSHSLTSRHNAGRVRFVDVGSAGYVITQPAARHFLQTTPKMLLAIDHALLRFWVNGLNVFYVDPAVVYTEGIDDSQIEEDRRTARKLQHQRDGAARILLRRTIAGAQRAVHKRVAFRRLLRGEIGVTQWL